MTPHSHPTPKVQNNITTSTIALTPAQTVSEKATAIKKYSVAIAPESSLKNL